MIYHSSDSRNRGGTKIVKQIPIRAEFANDHDGGLPRINRNADTHLCAVHQKRKKKIDMYTYKSNNIGVIEVAKELEFLDIHYHTERS